MSDAKQIVDTFHSTRDKSGVTPYELSAAKLKAVSDLIALKVTDLHQWSYSEAPFWAVDYTKAYSHDAKNNKAIPLFISEGDWVKVPVYLKIGGQYTCAGSLIAHFTRDNILLSGSNRLIQALVDKQKSASELKQIDVDLAIAEEDLRKTIVAASSGNGKKLGATRQEILKGINTKDKSTETLCASMLDFLEKNNPFLMRRHIRDTLKQNHCEQLRVLEALLTRPESSQGSVQVLKELNEKINPWPLTVAGWGLIFGGIILALLSIFLPVFVCVYLEQIPFDFFPFFMPLLGGCFFVTILGVLSSSLGETLVKGEFKLQTEILDAESTANSRIVVVVEQEQVIFQTIETVVQEIPYLQESPQALYVPQSLLQSHFMSLSQANLGNSQLGHAPASAVPFSPFLQSLFDEQKNHSSEVTPSLVPGGNFSYPPAVSQPSHQPLQYGYLPQVNPQPYQPANSEASQLGVSSYPPGYPPGYTAST